MPCDIWKQQLINIYLSNLNSFDNFVSLSTVIYYPKILKMCSGFKICYLKRNLGVRFRILWVQSSGLGLYAPVWRAARLLLVRVTFFWSLSGSVAREIGLERGFGCSFFVRTPLRERRGACGVRGVSRLTHRRVGVWSAARFFLLLRTKIGTLVQRWAAEKYSLVRRKKMRFGLVERGCPLFPAAFTTRNVIKGSKL
jgi:hypothetical protein